MPEYTVNWEVRVHGTCNVDAEDEDAARVLVEGGNEGAELVNINEMLGPVEVTKVEYFADSPPD